MKDDGGTEGQLVVGDPCRYSLWGDQFTALCPNDLQVENDFKDNVKKNLINYYHE